MFNFIPQTKARIGDVLRREARTDLLFQRLSQMKAEITGFLVPGSNRVHYFVLVRLATQSRTLLNLCYDIFPLRIHLREALDSRTGMLKVSNKFI